MNALELVLALFALDIELRQLLLLLAIELALDASGFPFFVLTGDAPRRLSTPLAHCSMLLLLLGPRWLELGPLLLPFELS